MTGFSDAVAQTATWSGGNSFLSYGSAPNWSPAAVPANQAGLNYTVIVPDNSSLVYDLSSNAVIDALSFGAGSVLRLTNLHSLSVVGPALVKGQIDASGTGSGLLAPANVTVLSSNPRLYASDGAQIKVGASSFGWNLFNANATLLSAVGSGSLIDLTNLNSMVISYGDGGSWAYSINARSNGIVDLSFLNSVSGPGQDDWVDFNMDSGGLVKLDRLRQVANRARFNIANPLVTFPALEQISDTSFTLSSNTTVRTPALLSDVNASISVGAGSVFEARNLVTLDNITLNLAGNGAFIATNLTSFRNSDIILSPARNMQLGPLTDIYSSRLQVSGGMTFQIGALAYQTRGQNFSPTILGAQDSGSLLDASSLKTIEVVGGGEDHWSSTASYNITANSNAVVDLSGVETVLGATYGRNAGRDYLTFNLWNGGDIRLDSARTISRYTKFNIEVPQFALPALETVDTTTFNIANGSRLNVTNLARMQACTLNFGFNSTLNAPKLLNFIDTDLSLSPGVIINAPPFTNIHASRLAVSSGGALHVAAASYDAPENWQWSPTLFSADGTGALLDLAAMRSITTPGGDGGSRYYSIIANNNGVVDLSGLLNATGGRSDAYGNDDWLQFTVRNGGSILLNSLRSASRHVRFNIEVPFYSLPSLQSADTTVFALADGARLNVPSLGLVSASTLSLGLNGIADAAALTNFTSSTLTLGQGSLFNAANLQRFDSSALNWGNNSTCNVPNLLNFINSDLVLAPGRGWFAPNFTNIHSARLSVSGGETLQVAAPEYQMRGLNYSPTVMGADGVGSQLDLSSLQSFEIVGGGEDYWSSTATYTIIATNSGVVDLSGVKNMLGASYSRNSGPDYLAIRILGGGDVRLNSLTNLSRRTSFEVRVPNYSLPALQTVDSTIFTVGDNTHIAAPTLTRLHQCSFNWGFNSTFDAASLRNFTDSSLTLIPGINLLAPPFTNIYTSRIAVNGGSVLHLAPPSYEIYDDWRTSPTLLSVDGIGSLLDLAPMKIFTVYGGWGGAWNYSANAQNLGVLDLSGLDTITGARFDAYDNDDWLSFNATSGGVIRFGNAAVTRRVRFNVGGENSLLQFAGLNLNSPATLTANTRAIVDVRGNVSFNHTDPNAIVIEGSPLQMDGSQPQTLEVGGKNLGPTGASSRNFGYSQLIIGRSNQTSVVRLQDVINNGQRGPSGESEALYLYGLDGQGLRLVNNSKLIFNNVPVYALLGGQMRLLNGLVSPSTNSLSFDGGILANAAGPKIVSMTPSIAVTPPVSSVDVTFDIPIKGTTFTVADVTITGPGGPVAATSIAPLSGNTYRVSFAAQTTSGPYTVKVGPAINEAAENLTGMDQDGDGLGGEAVDDAFTSSFIIDGIAPVVVSAIALQNGNRVGVTFDEPVPASIATNPANYLVNGLAPTKAMLQTNGTQVALWVGALVGESFTLNVNNLADALGNTTNRAFTGMLMTMEMRDIGAPGSNPVELGATLTFNGTDFEMVSGGENFYWNGSDAGHFAFESRPGDFDVRVQIARLDRANTYSQAGIMWRESTAANARRVFACLNDPNSYNRYWALIRYNPGEGGTEFPGSPGPGIGSLPAWVRLQRVGNIFVAYRGTDGTNWIEYGRVTTSFPSGGIVGPASDANYNSPGAYSTTWYRSYGDITPAIVTQPQSQSVASGANVSFGVTARGLPVLAYQWLFNGVAISGATNNLFSRTSVTTNHVGDYRVVVTNAYGAITSQVAVLVVDGVGAGGFEADISPTPYGNNSVSVSDWVRVGRLVAGLEAPLSSSDFQRADCAPRTNALLGTLPLGDARLSVADWTQAGRYAAALDPLTSAGGPNAPVAGAPMPAGLRAASVFPSTAVTLRDTRATLGQSFPVILSLSGGGWVNAAGFSVHFDPARLLYVRTDLARPTTGSVLQVNTNDAANGNLGFVVSTGPMETFAAGDVDLLEISFIAKADSGTTLVAFDDLPVVREVVDVYASVFSQVTYQNAAVTLVKAPQLSSLKAGVGQAEFTIAGDVGETYLIFASTDLVHWVPFKRVVMGAEPIVVADPSASQFKQRFYRAVPQP